MKVNFSIFLAQHNLNITETTARNSLPPPTSVQELEDVHREERYNIPLGTLRNVYGCGPRKAAAVLKEKVGPTQQ
jgi:hypothetical protein